MSVGIELLKTIAPIATSVAGGLAEVYTKIKTPALLEDATPVFDFTERTQALTQGLSDLTIPQDLSSWLQPPLAALGFTIEPFEVKYGSVVNKYSLIKNEYGRRAVFNIPSQYLEDLEGRDSLGVIIFATRLRDQPLLFLSRGVNAAHVVYTVFTEPWWADDLRVNASLVPWRHLMDTKSMGENEQQQTLLKILKLEELSHEAVAILSIDQIDDEEIIPLARIFADIPRFIDDPAEGWRTFLYEADLKQYVGEFDLTGMPIEVASRVLRAFRRYRPDPRYPKDQVLGLLLSQACKLEEIKRDCKNYIQSTLKKYNLAPSRVNQ
jgi:hypothetical protein